MIRVGVLSQEGVHHVAAGTNIIPAFPEGTALGAWTLDGVPFPLTMGTAVIANGEDMTIPLAFIKAGRDMLRARGVGPGPRVA